MKKRSVTKGLESLLITVISNLEVELPNDRFHAIGAEIQAIYYFNWKLIIALNSVFLTKSFNAHLVIPPKCLNGVKTIEILLNYSQTIFSIQIIGYFRSVI